jgi:urease gamma subunit
MNTNMEKVNSIGDNIFEAISIIATDILEKAPIDKTVECIVIDDSKQKENTYTVMEGTASFTASAISGVICKKFDKVLVRIPEGNYGK